MTRARLVLCSGGLVEALEFVSDDRYQFDFRKLTRKREKDAYLEFGDCESTPFIGVERVLYPRVG